MAPSSLVVLALTASRLIHAMTWEDAAGRTRHRAWLPLFHRRVQAPFRTVRELAARGWLERRRTWQKPAGEA